MTHGRALVGAGNADAIKEAMEPGDLVLVSNRECSQIAALEGGAGCLVVCTAAEIHPEILAKADIEAAEIYRKTEAEVAKIYAEAQSANMELYQFLKELDVIVSSVTSDTVLVVTSDTYPFNVLLQYGSSLEEDADNQTVITDLEYILAHIPEPDRQALIDGVYALIEEARGTDLGGAA